VSREVSCHVRCLDSLPCRVLGRPASPALIFVRNFQNIPQILVPDSYGVHKTFGVPYWDVSERARLPRVVGMVWYIDRLSVMCPFILQMPTSTTTEKMKYMRREEKPVIIEVQRPNRPTNKKTGLISAVNSARRLLYGVEV
jgi:hypothetical protein